MSAAVVSLPAHSLARLTLKGVRANTIASLSARLVAQPGPLPTPCQVYVGILDARGYARVKFQGRRVYLHRLLFEHVHGPQDGLDLDHLCRVPACCALDHLEPVTHAENVRRGEGLAAQNARKTHCVNGHALAGENLRLHRKRNGRTERVCRSCNIDRAGARLLAGRL